MKRIPAWVTTPEELPTTIEGVRMSREDMIVEICRLSGLEGYAPLPDPTVDPGPSKALLQAFVAVYGHMGLSCVRKKHLTTAYKKEFGRRRKRVS